jgi:beta-glucosidase-like glycosyl hydrolase
MASLESDRPTLLKLCWLITQQWKAELAYSRAQWRVSYYRKLKAKLENSKKTSEKWSDHSELAKKIETERLTTLKKQKQLMDLKKKLNAPIAQARTKLKAEIVWNNSGCAQIYLPGIIYTSDAIADMADQYEADKVLTRVLKEGKNKV